MYPKQRKQKGGAEWKSAGDGAGGRVGHQNTTNNGKERCRRLLEKERGIFSFLAGFCTGALSGTSAPTNWLVHHNNICRRPPNERERNKIQRDAIQWRRDRLALSFFFLSLHPNLLPNQFRHPEYSFDAVKISGNCTLWTVSGLQLKANITGFFSCYYDSSLETLVP